MRRCTVAGSCRFLSTLSLRRATSSQPTAVICQCDFYPRSPCGERRAGRPRSGWTDGISIHALLAESDDDFTENAVLFLIFLSTLSLRRATVTIPTPWESPTFLSTLSLRRATFPGADLVWDSQFLSTLSLRRATGALKHVHQTGEISIHALLAESD